MADKTNTIVVTNDDVANEEIKVKYIDQGDGTYAEKVAAELVVGSAGWPAAIVGPGDPVIDSYGGASVVLAANTTNQVLIAAPGANKQIWVYGLYLEADTAAGTVTLQDEDDTAHSGAIALSDEGGFVLPLSGNFSQPWFKVATNKALEADTVTCSAAGLISYAIVSV